MENTTPSKIYQSSHSASLKGSGSKSWGWNGCYVRVGDGGVLCACCYTVEFCLCCLSGDAGVEALG
jgi:hypothetical protein